MYYFDIKIVKVNGYFFDNITKTVVMFQIVCRCTATAALKNKIIFNFILADIKIVEKN